MLIAASGKLCSYIPNKRGLRNCKRSWLRPCCWDLCASLHKYRTNIWVTAWKIVLLFTPPASLLLRWQCLACHCNTLFNTFALVWTHLGVKESPEPWNGWNCCGRCLGPSPFLSLFCSDGRNMKSEMKWAGYVFLWHCSFKVPTQLVLHHKDWLCIRTWQVHTLHGRQHRQCHNISQRSEDLGKNLSSAFINKFIRYI